MRKPRECVGWIWWAALSLALSGCATMSRTSKGPREASYVVDPATTPLGRALLPEEQRHPGQSGFDLVSYGLEALVARTAIVDAATKSIDAQYYIYAADEAGSLFMLHLIDAAKRGVRVRLLLDDYNLRDDRDLAILSMLPNFQIRVFNPVPFRARWARLPEYVLTFARADRRMHNKLLIGDNAVAILGGRNIADDYFDLETEATFRDFDLLAAGPSVRTASAAFDEYWNSPFAVPATELVHARPGEAEFETLERRLHQRAQGASKFETQYQAIRSRYLSGMLVDRGGLVWAHGEIVADSPRKVTNDEPPADSVAGRLNEEWGKAQHQVLIEAAYFIPGKSGIDRFRDMVQRGVEVKLLTCALATTDVPLVYIAYQKYRPDLIQAGVDLHEYKLPAPKPTGQRRPWYRSGSSEAILHSKVVVFDDRRIWIGSLNMDPRSTRLNTEIAAVVDSDVLAHRLAEDIRADMAPDRSWKLEMAGQGGDLHLVWKGEKNGKPVLRQHEPGSFLRRFDDLLLSVVPGLENQL